MEPKSFVLRYLAEHLGRPHIRLMSREICREDTATALSASLVVLPFANLNGNPEEDYLSNGITEDIITELLRFSELRIIARHSSFH